MTEQAFLSGLAAGLGTVAAVYAGVVYWRKHRDRQWWKLCSVCGNLKPATLDHWYIDSRGWPLYGRCRPCAVVYPPKPQLVVTYERGVVQGQVGTHETQTYGYTHQRDQREKAATE